jgi:hypothetical protein
MPDTDTPALFAAVRAWAATYYPGWSVERITIAFDRMGKAVLPVPACLLKGEHNRNPHNPGPAPA